MDAGQDLGEDVLVDESDLGNATNAEGDCDCQCPDDCPW